MSKTQLRPDTRQCGTCRWWTGQRQPDNSVIYIEFDTESSGKCCCNSGNFRQQIMKAKQQCTNWEQQFRK